MKNIEAILTDAGITVTAEQLTAINEGVKANYKTITDYQKQADKLTAESEKVTTLTASLDKFTGVDPDALNSTIADLKKQLEDKDTEYTQKIKDRDFDDMLVRSIADSKGKNATAIKALLDIDTLKKSSNQQADITAALKKLHDDEGTAFLFEAVPTGGKTSPIGRISRPAPAGNYIDEKYKNNPYYHPNIKK